MLDFTGSLPAIARTVSRLLIVPPCLSIFVIIAFRYCTSRLLKREISAWSWRFERFNSTETEMRGHATRMENLSHVQLFITRRAKRCETRANRHRGIPLTRLVNWLYRQGAANCGRNSAPFAILVGVGSPLPRARRARNLASPFFLFLPDALSKSSRWCSSIVRDRLLPFPNGSSMLFVEHDGPHDDLLSTMMIRTDRVNNYTRVNLFNLSKDYYFPISGIESISMREI